MPGWPRSAGSGPLTWMLSTTSIGSSMTAWVNLGMDQQHQRKEEKEEDDAAQTANLTKEKRNENQSDQRIRGRPGESPALLDGGAGVCKEDGLFAGAISLADRSLAEEPEGTELQLCLKQPRAAKAYQQAMFQQSQPAAMFFTDDGRVTTSGSRPAAPSSPCRPPTSPARPLRC